jgi:two-component system response regulator QseB|tara:strand:+ start:225814 stop:226485 length:672 start_codon:yes stop_codon:yes gene_type:complete
MRLLLIEDDELLGDAVKTGLTQFGYVVDWLKDGESARLALKNESFELVILDLSLPKLPGLSLLKNIRQVGNKTPVIILTARESVEDRIEGLDAGADDYMFKPFDLNELSARIRALIRRSQGRADTLIKYKNITMDPSAHTVLLNNAEVNISRREFSLLQKLLENTGHALSREQLMQSMYGWDDDLDSNVLEVHIHNLRKKLQADFIRTIRGIGYIAEKESNAS